jgi:hypothetical protein
VGCWELVFKNSKRGLKILPKRLITMSMSWKYPLRQLARCTVFILSPKSPWSFSRLAIMVRIVLKYYINVDTFFFEKPNENLKRKFREVAKPPLKGTDWEK